MVFTRGGRIQTTHHIHEGRLPAPRRAHQSNVLVGFNLQIQTIQGMHELGPDLISLAQPLDRNERFHISKGRAGNARSPVRICLNH